MLTELLVGMLVAIIVFGATMGALEVFMRQSSRTDKQAQAQDSARTAVDRFAAYARSATSVTGSTTPPVEQNSDYDVVFLAPNPAATLTNNAQGLQHVRYCLDASTVSNEKLWLQTSPYSSATQAAPPSTSGCPDTAPGWTRRQVVASNIVNQMQTPAKPFFNRTTDSGGVVSDIAVDAWVDVDPAGGAPVSRLQSSVTLRNLNHTPVAAVPTCTASGNGHVLCDASGSSDPDGQSLFYKWKIDSGAFVDGSSSYDASGATLVSGSTHTFTVQVTDTGQASSTQTSASVTLP